MSILDELVERYLRDLRPERSEVMREMEEQAEHESVPIVHWETGRLVYPGGDHETYRPTWESAEIDFAGRTGFVKLAIEHGVPIVHWETGRLLAVICRVLDPVVLEVGTAIGYSTLHMAEQLERGRVVTLERDPERARQARSYLERGGVAERVEIVEGDALETLPELEGPFDLLFVDASKGEYARYIELAESKLSERALMVVDNLLMSGEVALPEDAETWWNSDSLASARRLNSELLASDDWLSCVLPVGDGIGVAARR
jgi:predicted O-methyltransferase YrrM